MPKPQKSDTPILKTVRANAHWKGKMRSDVDVREFSVIVAEPEKLGGGNEAPTPMEYVGAALNGCLGITIDIVAREQEFAFDGMDIQCAGVVDHRGLFGMADVSPHFQTMQIDVTLVTNESVERLPALKEQVLSRCPVYNLINDSGTDVTINWTLRNGGD